MFGKIFYITKEKLQELKKDYEQLVAFEHNKMMGQEAPKVFESEDINPEFISFQEDISFLRSRIDELKDILGNYELIKKPPKERRMFVNLGAEVKIEVAGKHDEFTILGTLEANPNLGRISNESPVGKALLGHKVGDVITISSPIKTTYTIKGITYEIS